MIDERTGLSNIDVLTGSPVLDAALGERLAPSLASLSVATKAAEAMQFLPAADQLFNVALVFPKGDARLQWLGIADQQTSVVLLKFASFTTARIAPCVFTPENQHFARADCDLLRIGGWSAEHIGHYERDLFLRGGIDVLQDAATIR